MYWSSTLRTLEIRDFVESFDYTFFKACLGDKDFYKSLIEDLAIKGLIGI